MIRPAICRRWVGGTRPTPPTQVETYGVTDKGPIEYSIVFPLGSPLGSITALYNQFKT